jgi:hypothetical protein
MFHDLTVSLAQQLFALAQQMQMLGFLLAFLIVAFRFEKFGFMARLCVIAALFGVAPGLFFWGARELALREFSPGYVDYFFPLDAWHTWATSAACGFAAVIAWLRWGVQLRDWSWGKLTRRSLTERNRKTDVREIHLFLPKEIGKYNPEKYINISQGIFFGLDERKKAIYLAWEEWRLSHLLLSGKTRIGKGVAAQILLSQAVRAGELVVILDPKPDDWMPHVFYQATERAALPYHFFNLTPSAQPQFNLFAGLNGEDAEGMLIGGFGLSEKGEAADFYRLADRKAAREAAAWIQAHPGATPREVWLANTEKWADAAPAFNDYMRELAELPAVNAKVEFDMRHMLATGGCLYFAGDMMNPRVVRVQRMILIRLMQIAKNRADRSRTITVLADEFKVHISKPFMVGLGAAAGWGMHVVLAFQSLQDLADCPADLDKDSVRGAVMENCGLQLSYRVKDPETAEWLSKSTGTILVDDETRRVKRNVALSEEVDGERNIRQADRYYIDENMFMNLPKSCGVLTGVSPLAQFCYTSPIIVQKNGLAITPATFAAAADSPSPDAAEHQHTPSGASVLFDV